MPRLIGAAQAVATTAALTSTFNSSGTFNPVTATFDALVIAGGGGGGVENVSVGVGGGGGAGGFREVEDIPSPGSPTPVTVGAGGAGAADSGAVGSMELTL